MTIDWQGVNWAYIWTLTVVVVDNLIRISALFYVPRNRRPTAGMAWLMLIFLAPVLGLLIFLVIGSKRLPKSRERKQEGINQLVADLAAREEESLVTDIAELPSGVESAVRLGRSLGAQPMLLGNSASICIDYERSFAQMAEAIGQAREYVHVEFYILVHDATTDCVFQAMREAVARGVRVRVLLDHISAIRNPGAKRTAQSLTDLGAEWD